MAAGDHPVRRRRINILLQPLSRWNPVRYDALSNTAMYFYE